jgi:hypothetical protein
MEEHKTQRVVMSVSDFLKKVCEDRPIGRHHEKVLNIKRYCLRRLVDGQVRRGLSYQTLVKLITAYGGEIVLNFPRGPSFSVQRKPPGRPRKIRRLPSEDTGNSLPL